MPRLTVKISEMKCPVTDCGRTLVLLHFIVLGQIFPTWECPQHGPINDEEAS